MRILHVSHFNTVNVPFTYCQMYRHMGHEARLLTLYKHRGSIPEDICLRKPVRNPSWLSAARARATEDREETIRTYAGPRPWLMPRPGPAIRALLGVRDWLRSLEFRRVSGTLDLDNWDLYHFHGGMDWFRDSRWVRRLAAAGKPIICNYHGPDIRARGVIRDVDRASLLNITNEHDLLALHPDLQYIAIPYDCSHLPRSTPPADTLRIIHTPSVPRWKGTHLIEPVLRRLASERRIEVVILTGVSRQRVLEEKMRSHIAIEQIGNLGGTGYGVNSLETLAMGLPTVTEFTPEYEAFLPEHPFVLANQETLHDVLLKLIDNQEYRRAMGAAGRPWVEATHGYEAVWRTLVTHVRTKSAALAGRLQTERGTTPVPPLPENV
jgi:glycosyltransferase involved in cell wall biosynthesis